MEKRWIEWFLEKCVILWVNKNRMGRIIDFRVFYVKYGLLYVEFVFFFFYRFGVKLDRVISIWR